MIEIVTPGDFGAAGDGVADDTAEVQAALSSGFKLITLTPGKTYKVTAPLTVPAGVFISATGATLFASHKMARR